VTET
jgi:hypothetical protein